MKKRKGFTIAEVLVSLTVFGIIFFTCVTTFNGASRAYYREKEYVTFESICTDIDAYCSMYGTNWYNRYFKFYNLPGIGGSEVLDYYTENDYSSHCVYFSDEFKSFSNDWAVFFKVDNIEGDKPLDYKYVLSWKYGVSSTKHFLIVDIYEQLEEGQKRYIVENLDFGWSRFYHE